MGLARSIFSGASGLRNHQTMMDVIANNIANVNTTGFKLGRVSFAETFAQTLRGTTQPLSNIGGSNPIQVGLGMSLSGIDTLFSQGNIQTTGQTTDLALEGDGFFILSDGNRRYYTRAGGFKFDGSGYLINPSNGFRVQGKTADEDGTIPPEALIGDIYLPFGQKMPARATTMADIAGNLDASLNPDGSIHQSEALFAIELAGDDNDIDGLYANGNTNDTISGMINNSTTVSFTYDGVQTDYTYVDADASVGNGNFNSIDDLIDEINDDYSVGGANVLTASLNAAGQINFTDLSTAGDRNLVITSTNPIFEDSLYGANALLALAGSSVTDEFSHTAVATDLLTNLRNSTGQPFGLIVGDEITITGDIGDVDDPDTPLDSRSDILGVTATSTYQNYVDAIETAFSLTNLDGVQISENDGSLIINADAGRDYMISSIEILADDTPGVGGTARANFDAVFGSSTGNWDLSQEAVDVQQSASVTIYDSLGKEYNMTLIFTKDVKAPNRWQWEADIPQPSIVTGGQTGTVEFNSDGSLNRFRYDGGASTLQFDPGGDGSAELMSVDLNAGLANSFEGLTQMTGAGGSLIIREQDGYSMGEMERIAIGEAGQVTGSFTNGIIKTLGQIMLAAFNNPSGLLRTKDNMYTTSANTGTPIIATAGGGVRASVRSGALEQSNVDLAEEFTTLIVAQRGFQAAARVITTSDTMLTEVTNLKR